MLLLHKLIQILHKFQTNYFRFYFKNNLFYINILQINDNFTKRRTLSTKIIANLTYVNVSVLLISTKKFT